MLSVGLVVILCLSAPLSTNGKQALVPAQKYASNHGGVVTDFTGSGINDPHGITVGPDGALWFTNQIGEGTDSSIGRIALDGAVTSYPYNSGESCPSGIVTGPDGALWFADPCANAIVRITTDGQITSYTGPDIDLPEDIVVGSDGALWFTNYEKDDIGRITTAGVVTAYTNQNVVGSWGIVSGPDGALWFTDSGRPLDETGSIGRLTTSGTFTFFTAYKIYQPEPITVGSNGNLWFADTGLSRGAVVEMTTSGRVKEFRGGGIGQETSVTEGPDGAVWCTSANHTIVRISVTGQISKFYDDPGIREPQGITTGPDGALWFTNEGSIGRITAVPEISAEPATGPPGSDLSVSGEGYTPGETVQVEYKTKIAGSEWMDVCSGPAASDGTFSCSGDLPSSESAGPVGNHKLHALGLSSGAVGSSTFALT